MPVLEIILLVFMIILAIPVLILMVQILASLGYTKKTIDSLYSNFSVAVIIPAHNESSGIATTLQCIIPQMSNKDQLIVVADNCTDDTAKIARTEGATVIERENKTLRGKSYALDFAVKYLASHPPEIVIIIDADCTISTNGIRLLAHHCITYQRPIQALYLMTSLMNASLKLKVAEFAWVVKNKVRPLGAKKLGMPCQLMGTGMTFLWEDISKIDLATGHIAEDMKMGIDLCRINKPPMFLPEVLVKSFFPITQDASDNQRTRWEHGHLNLILSDAPALLIEAISSKNLQMLGMTLDLIVPPLAVLSLIIALVTFLNLVIYQFFAIDVALVINILTLIVLTSIILIAWSFYGRHIISFKQLCYAPVYALTKIPLYVKFLVARQVEWVRTKRTE